MKGAEGQGRKKANIILRKESKTITIKIKQSAIKFILQVSLKYSNEKTSMRKCVCMYIRDIDR